MKRSIVPYRYPTFREIFKSIKQGAANSFGNVLYSDGDDLAGYLKLYYTGEEEGVKYLRVEYTPLGKQTAGASFWDDYTTEPFVPTEVEWREAVAYLLGFTLGRGI